MPIRHTPIKISLFEFAYLKASSLFEVAVEINSVNLTATESAKPCTNGYNKNHES